MLVFCAIIILMENNLLKSTARSVKHFNTTLCVFIVIRVVLFIAFALPVRIVPEYNYGGGILTAFFYFGPMICVDLFLTIYFIRIKVITQKVKKVGGFTGQSNNYLQTPSTFFAVWVIVAVGAALFIFLHEFNLTNIVF